MPLRIKHNSASVSALRHLSETQNNLSTSLQRLASGQRINSGADAPVGLMMSEGLRAQIAGVKQALADSEFSLSLVQTAEGALVEANNLLLEMRQLAIAAANEGANDNRILTALQLQVRSALEAIDRVSRYTRFGNKNLLDGSQGTTGMGGSEDLAFVSATAQTRASPLRGYSVDVERLPRRAGLVADLDDEDAQGLRITLEEEDGALISVKNPEGGTASGFANRLQQVAANANLDLDIRYDPEAEELTIEHRAYGLARGFTISASKDGVLVDEAYKPELFLGQDIQGTIGGEEAEGDGIILTGLHGNPNTSGLSVAYSGEDDGGVGSVTVAQNSLEFQAGSEAGDKIQIAINSIHSSALGRGVENSSGFGNLSEVQIGTTQGAIDTIRLVDGAIDQLSLMRGQLGSVQKYTLESNISALRTAAENLTAAESNIRDADMAMELASFTKNEIMMEASAAAVAQANQATARVLRLLFSDLTNNQWTLFFTN